MKLSDMHADMVSERIPVIVRDFVWNGAEVVAVVETHTGALKTSPLSNLKMRTPAHEHPAAPYVE